MNFKLVTTFRSRKRRINRKHKNRLFRLIFNNKTDLLTLYNAVNHTNYNNPDELIFTTIDDVIYLGMKKDVSFLISNTLNLYEHQSTQNPNMPLRGLFYFSDMLKAYVTERDFNLYGKKLIPLPFPQYMVFYNGTEDEPDAQELLLSDAFPQSVSREKSALECKAVMLNINLVHRKLNNCPENAG